MVGSNVTDSNVVGCDAIGSAAVGSDNEPGTLGSVNGCPVIAGARLVTVYRTLEVKGPLEEVAGSGFGFGVASGAELDAKADGENVGIEYVGVMLDDDDSEDTGGPVGNQVVSARDSVGDAAGSVG